MIMMCTSEWACFYYRLSLYWGNVPTSLTIPCHECKQPPQPLQSTLHAKVLCLGLKGCQVLCFRMCSVRSRVQKLYLSAEFEWNSSRPVNPRDSCSTGAGCCLFIYPMRITHSPRYFLSWACPRDPASSTLCSIKMWFYRPSLHSSGGWDDLIESNRCRLLLILLLSSPPPHTENK